MTNNSRPARRRCTDCNRVLTASNHSRAMNAPEFCDDCMNIAGLENEHQDGYHDADAEGPNDDCPMCTGEPIADRSKPSNEITKMTKGSHADCYAAKAHAADKKGRAACRAARAAKA